MSNQVMDQAKTKTSLIGGEEVKFIWKFGKWRSERDIKSLAAYKYVTYDNQEDLQEGVDYSEYDVYTFNPIFRFTPGEGNSNWIREIVAPEGLFKHFMEQMMEWEEGEKDEYEDMFEFEVTKDYKHMHITFRDKVKHSIRMKWDDDYMNKIEEMSVFTALKDRKIVIDELIDRFDPELNEIE